jgi:hypothetical protein
MADLALAMSGRRGEMIIDDLRAEPSTQAIIVEGTPLRPSVISQVIVSRAHAVFLAPTPLAEERNLRARGGHAHTQTSDPERAHTNRIAREILVAQRIAGDAMNLGGMQTFYEISSSWNDLRSSSRLASPTEAQHPPLLKPL